MPSPKRADLDDYYAQLPDVAVPHLTKLRELCQKGLPKAEEALHWNNPAFVQDGTRLVMLQSYKQHCSLRFPTRSSHRRPRRSPRLGTRRARASSSCPTTATFRFPCSGGSSRPASMSSKPLVPVGRCSPIGGGGREGRLDAGAT